MLLLTMRSFRVFVSLLLSPLLLFVSLMWYCEKKRLDVFRGSLGSVLGVKYILFVLSMTNLPSCSLRDFVLQVCYCYSVGW